LIWIALFEKYIRICLLTQFNSIFFHLLQSVFMSFRIIGLLLTGLGVTNNCLSCHGWPELNLTGWKRWRRGSRTYRLAGKCEFCMIWDQAWCSPTIERLPNPCLRTLNSLKKYSLSRIGLCAVPSYCVLFNVTFNLTWHKLISIDIVDNLMMLLFEQIIDLSILSIELSIDIRLIKTDKLTLAIVSSFPCPT